EKDFRVRSIGSREPNTIGAILPPPKSRRTSDLSRSLICSVRNAMPLIKLNRINKGGEIFLNSLSILFIEIESRSTTIHMTHNLLFSVEETPNAIAEKVEGIQTARIKNAIQQNELGGEQ